jgi:hypothetical protein
MYFDKKTFWGQPNYLGACFFGKIFGKYGLCENFFFLMYFDKNPKNFGVSQNTSEHVFLGKILENLDFVKLFISNVKLLKKKCFGVSKNTPRLRSILKRG